MTKQIITLSDNAAQRIKEIMSNAEKDSLGVRVGVKSGGCAAHLPGMTAAKTHLPVIGVPVKTKSLEGKDSLLSIVQMPAGIPVATVAIGKAGSINAALLAASILSIKYPSINKKILAYRKKQTQRVLKSAKLI